MSSRRWVAMMLLPLCGCTVHYTLDGKQLNTREEFVAALGAVRVDRLAKIRPLTEPVSERTLVYVMPSYDAMKNAQKTNDQVNSVSRTKVQRVDIDAKILSAVNNYLLTGEMLRKRNIFREVRHIESATAAVSPSAGENEDVLYISCDAHARGQVMCGAYYISKKFGREKFTYDRGSKDLDERNRMFLEAVEARAIRE